MTDPDILTVKEAAKLLRVSEDLLRAAADKGDVPSLRIGAQRRFSRSALFDAMTQPHPRSRCSQGAPESAVRPLKLGKVRAIRG